MEQPYQVTGHVRCANCARLLYGSTPDIQAVLEVTDWRAEHDDVLCRQCVASFRWSAEDWSFSDDVTGETDLLCAVRVSFTSGQDNRPPAVRSHDERVAAFITAGDFTAALAECKRRVPPA